MAFPKPPTPSLAAFLSFILPGLGQIYNGQLWQAGFWLVITPLIWIGTGGLLGWVCHIIAAYIAYTYAKHSVSKSLRPLPFENSSKTSKMLSVRDGGIEVEEVRRWFVPLNNCGNSISTKSTVSQSIAFEETMELGTKKEFQTGGKLGLSGAFVGFSLDIQKSLEKHFRRTFGTTHTETRSIELSAEARTNMQFTLAIKHVWRKGEVIMENVHGQVEAIPFRVREGAELELVSSENISCK